MPITVKQRGPSGYAVGRSIATETYILNGATALSANAAGGEVVDSMSIAEIIYTGDWLIARGANTVFDSGGVNLGGHFDFQAHGMQLEASQGDREADCSCTLTGSGTLVIKFHKKSGQV